MVSSDEEGQTSLDTFKSSLARFSYDGESPASLPKATSSRINSGHSSPSKRRSPLKRSAAGSSTLQPQTAKRVKRGYTGPETYAHLGMLQDYLSENLDVVFCGINPGVTSAETGCHFANPTNHFWKCLHESGFTNERLPPSDGPLLPERYRIGLTNLVERPSAEQAELSASEMMASVPALLAKISKFRPRMVCFVGVGIWVPVEKAILRVSPQAKRSVKTKNFTTGLRLYKMSHSSEDQSPSADVGDEAAALLVSETLFYVVPSTSGLVQSYQLPDKVKLFTELKHCLERCKKGELDMKDTVEISRTLYAGHGESEKESE